MASSSTIEPFEKKFTLQDDSKYNFMNVQYITDDTGKTTGVFIPISDWNRLKSKYVEINEETTIPEFHKDIVRNRMAEYIKNSKIGLDFDKVIAELKNE
ncbi:MAG: hypothetical protein WAT22_18935 [Saprospiraceae bacterium]|nr:hypothetical protein [Saprospiraceae bacterium]MBP6540417.1 hypothetical protein [Saprospiraceae bacterium]